MSVTQLRDTNDRAVSADNPERPGADPAGLQAAATGQGAEHPSTPSRPVTNRATREGTRRLWFDGGLHDAGAAQAALHTRALHYGSGVFEGIRAYATADGAA